VGAGLSDAAWLWLPASRGFRPACGRIARIGATNHP
jgi:hypothetical protein